MTNYNTSLLEAYKSYPSVRFIHKALEDNYFRKGRVALNFMHRADKCFIEIKDVKQERKFILHSIYNGLKSSLYKDCVFNNEDEKLDKKIKDELNGYLKHKFLKNYK